MLTVYVDGTPVDPATLAGYGTQWTIRTDGLVENLVGGAYLTTMPPWGLATVVDGRYVQQIGAVIGPHIAPPGVSGPPLGPLLSNQASNGAAAPAGRHWATPIPVGLVPGLSDPSYFSPPTVDGTPSGMLDPLAVIPGGASVITAASLGNTGYTGPGGGLAVDWVDQNDATAPGFGKSYAVAGGIQPFDPYSARSIAAWEAHGFALSDAMAKASAAASRLGLSVIQPAPGTVAAPTAPVPALNFDRPIPAPVPVSPVTALPPLAVSVGAPLAAPVAAAAPAPLAGSTPAVPVQSTGSTIGANIAAILAATAALFLLLNAGGDK